MRSKLLSIHQGKTIYFNRYIREEVPDIYVHQGRTVKKCIYLPCYIREELYILGKILAATFVATSFVCCCLQLLLLAATFVVASCKFCCCYSCSYYSNSKKQSFGIANVQRIHNNLHFLSYIKCYSLHHVYNSQRLYGPHSK